MVGVSTGLEPYFSFKFFRSGRLGKFIEVNAAIVDDWLKYNPEYSDDNLNFINKEVQDRVTKNKIYYYRQLAAPITSNNQEYSEG